MRQGTMLERADSIMATAQDIAAALKTDDVNSAAWLLAKLTLSLRWLISDLEDELDKSAE